MTMEKLELGKYGLPSEQPFDPAALDKMKMESFNQTAGSETGYDCPKCLNRGKIAFLRPGGGVAIGECDCAKVRRSIRKMERSGLQNVIREMTFERFQAQEDWQVHIKDRTMGYAEDPRGWLLLSGQSGSGKTHLCTAVCRQRLLAGDEVRYMPWRDEISRLKVLSPDSDQREKLLSELKTAPLLYMDDLFKTGRSADGTALPTAADVNIAFEILNYRYINHLPTIISTEKTPQELLEIDEATASRIMERAKGNIIHISRREKRNYRLRDVMEV